MVMNIEKSAFPSRFRSNDQCPCISYGPLGLTVVSNSVKSPMVPLKCSGVEFQAKAPLAAVNISTATVPTIRLNRMLFINVLRLDPCLDRRLRARVAKKLRGSRTGQTAVLSREAAVTIGHPRGLRQKAKRGIAPM